MESNQFLKNFLIGFTQIVKISSLVKLFFIGLFCKYFLCLVLNGWFRGITEKASSGCNFPGELSTRNQSTSREFSPDSLC